MQFLTNRFFPNTAHPTRKNNLLWHIFALVSVCCSFTLLANNTPSSSANNTATNAAILAPYSAKYHVFRKGKRHGEATQTLSHLPDNRYKLDYHSEIEWMVFSDSRQESTMFFLHQGQVHPLTYTMTRTGTGPDKEYQLMFNHQTKQIGSKASKYPLSVPWRANYQDALSYQAQARLDLKQGKTKLSYPFIDKKGNTREYQFQVMGTETITLPFGNIEAIKVKRLYDNNKRQVYAWFAPSLNYLLVKMYKGKEGVEQFQVQLSSYTPKN